MVTELKSQLDTVLALCPGCGGDSTRVIGGPGTAGGPKFWVGCDYCRWRTWGDTEADAIATWNIRAAVGGEAVAWAHKDGMRILQDDGEGSLYLTSDRQDEYGQTIPLYASSPATVPVAASECHWTYDTDTLTDTAWDTQCGHRHQFTNDGPVENEHKFCPYCGWKLAALIGGINKETT